MNSIDRCTEVKINQSSNASVETILFAGFFGVDFVFFDGGSDSESSELEGIS